MAKTDAGGLVIQVTQVALVVRLGALLLAAISVMTDAGQSLWANVGMIVVAITGLIALMSPAARRLVEEHPAVALLDVLTLTVVALAAGGTSPFVLTFMSSALVVGLWIGTWPGALILVTLLGLYLMVLTDPVKVTGVTGFVVPFALVTLWALGQVVRQAAASESRSRRALRSAVAVAAATEERGRIAREMHDTLAKSLQSMSLVASALPTLIERNPDRAKARAQELHETSVHAIADVRGLMSQLRLKPAEGSLSEAVEALVGEWSQRSGLEAEVVADDDADTDDELVRYELLMVLAEALENVARHAQARSVRVQLDAAPHLVRLTVSDDGVGTAADRLSQAAADGHFGVVGMRERMARVGGSLDWRSAPGQGTTVVASAHSSGLVEAALPEGKQNG